MVSLHPDPLLLLHHFLGLYFSLRDLFPPEWLQEQAEHVLNQWVPYITGSTDAFNVTVPVADRLDTMGRVIINDLEDDHAYTLFFADVVTPLAKGHLEKDGSLPFGIAVRSEDVTASAQTVVSRRWLRGHVEQVTGQLVPYLSGDTDSFAIRFPVADRIHAAAPAAKGLLDRSNVYDVLSTPEFEEEVNKQLQEFGALPCDVQLTSGQLVGVAQQIVERGWI